MWGLEFRAGGLQFDYFHGFGDGVSPTFEVQVGT